MVAPEHHRDLLARTRSFGELIGALGIAGHGADTHQIRTAEIGGNRSTVSSISITSASNSGGTSAASVVSVVAA
jgi:hypothetical protein